MTYYRLYVLDRDDRVDQAVELHCPSDDEAEAFARGHDHGAAMELWSLARLVRKYDRHSDQPLPPQA